MANRTLFLGLWDNYDERDPQREKAVQEVIRAVEEFGVVDVSFDYNGRTRHETAAHVMKSMLPPSYQTKIGYNYEFTVYKG